jgi:dephospho-CoA kinase
VLDSDAIVRSLYLRPEVRDAVVAHLGAGVLDAAGAIDRSRLATLAFASDEARAWLERLVHPLVEDAFRAWLAEAREPVPRALVHEVALLFEADLASRYDLVVLLDAPDALRAERVAGRGGLAALAERERRLMPVARKRELADVVIENAGPVPDLERAIDALLDART